VLAGGASVYIWREGDLTASGSSGLRMVIRRLSGAQMLGVEVHDLAKFRDQTDAQQGVFVGRVVAQSPAGRGGFRTGDVLIELAGKPTNSPGAVNRIAKGIKKGMAVEAVVLRQDARVELKIRF
jgi:S1-C subfamily serine protease